MKLNFILLPQLLCAIHEVSGSSHLSNTMAHRTQNASLQHSCFTRFATCLRCGEIFSHCFMANFPLSAPVKEF